jgi:lysophospholipase L1-like esterase
MNGALWIVEAAVALAILCVVAEYFARWWLRHFGAYYVWAPGLRLHLHPDPAVLPNLEQLVRIEVNADGERGSALPRSAGRVYRILVAGGSPVECALLDQPTSWPGALQGILSAPQHLRTLQVSAVHVGNIGLSGVTSQALNLILERVLRRYRHLDMIVVMVGGNDVFGFLAAGAPPSFAPRAIPASELFSTHPEGPFTWAPRGLALTKLVQGLRQRWIRPVTSHQGSGRWVHRVRAMRTRAKETRTSVPDPTPMLSLYEQQLRELLARAKSCAHRVLVLRQPWFKRDYTLEDLAHIWHGAVGDPHREEVSVYYSLEVLSQLMALVSARAARVADELGVEHLDSMSVLEPSLETFYDFVHFTPAGAAVLAQAVASAVLRSPSSSEVPASTTSRLLKNPTSDAGSA